jgi:hypothetical protein
MIQRLGFLTGEFIMLGDNKSYVPTLKEQIRRTRLNLMIHAYLYYYQNTSIISDSLYDEMSTRLVDLQAKKSKIGFYDEEFADWDGSTGYHLPTNNYIVGKAMWLLRYMERK